MSETIKQNPETADNQPPTSFDSLAQDSEQNWRAMQEAREQAEQDRINARNEKMGESVTELDYHLNPDNKVIGDSNWIGSPTEATKTKREKYDAKEVTREIIERAINADFTPVEEITAMVEQGAEGSFKQTAEYEGKQINIYNTGNLDFRFLQHSIQFNSAPNTLLTTDPSNWDKIDEQTANSEGRSNMLSFYYRSSTNPNEYEFLADSLRYGMVHLPPDSLRTITGGATQLRAGKGSIDLDPQIFTDSEDVSDQLVDSAYELQAFRYGDDGKAAFRPDFIIAPESGITKDTLRQAAYFDVPVFEIPTKHVETAEERDQAIEQQKQKITQDIESYIQQKVEINSSDMTPEELAEYTENLQQLASGTDNPAWEKRRTKLRHATLYQLIQQLESLN